MVDQYTGSYLAYRQTETNYFETVSILRLTHAAECLQSKYSCNSRGNSKVFQSHFRLSVIILIVQGHFPPFELAMVENLRFAVGILTISVILSEICFPVWADILLFPVVRRLRNYCL